MMIQLLTSFTGSLGFCLVFHLRRRYLLPASLGGVLTCGVYLAAASALDGILLPTLIASAFAALYAEVLAWLLRAPTPLFLTIALVIPLIPGRSLYYATYCAVRQEMSLARDYAAQTAEYALGIALGASLVWAFANMRLYSERFQHGTHLNKSEAAQQSLCRFAFKLSVTGKMALPIRTQSGFRPALPHAGYPAGDAAAAFCDGTAFPRSFCRTAPRSCSRQSVPGAGVL